MRGRRRLAGLAIRCALLGSVVCFVTPGSAVHDTTMTLTQVETARDVDFRDGAVWLLVLGSDAPSGQPVTSGDTDALQLVGIDIATGSAAAIGVPRDAWVDLGDHHARINTALKEGGYRLVSAAVEDLVGIAPDYVLVTAEDGFLAMVEAVGGVTVDSPQEFDTDEGGLHVVAGPNRFDADEALDFARTRRNLPGGDFDRSANHQALLLGLLRQLRDHEDEEGFMESASLAGLEGLDTDLAPTELYRLAQALTQIDPARANGCVIPGTPFVTDEGADVVLPDPAVAQRWADDVRSDARFDRPCGG